MLKIKKITKCITKIAGVALIATTLLSVKAEAAIVPVHRLVVKVGNRVDNFYTINSNEALYATTGGYKYLGPAFYASDVKEGVFDIPVYRLTNGFDHVLSTSKTEGSSLGYRYECVAFYASSSVNANDKIVPVYRFFNGHDHYCTLNVNEGYHFGYTGEGVKFYAQNAK